MLAEQIVPVAQDKIRFLFLGRYERRKGVEELNEAIRLILPFGAASTPLSDRTQGTNQHLNIEFQFIGPIPADKRVVHDQVIYHGEIRGREGLQALMRQCDVLLCPSWSEGMPNVILEAMANGLAVVATDVGATNVLVNKDTGWLLASSDPQEIKATIASILVLRPAEIDAKKQNALDLIRRDFTWERLGLKLLRQLKERSDKA